MTTDFEAIERDLTIALGRRLETRRRTNRRIRTALLTVAVAGAFSTAAIASGIAGDLQLDPTKWSILGGGDVDGGSGAYVHAQNREDGSNATFMVEHDAALAPYQAFLLHQKTVAAAQASSPVPVRVEPGELCSAAAQGPSRSPSRHSARRSPRAPVPTLPSRRSTMRRRRRSRARRAGASSTQASRRVWSTLACNRGRS